jgi:hypothetical protein
MGEEEVITAHGGHNKPNQKNQTKKQLVPYSVPSSKNQNKRQKFGFYSQITKLTERTEIHKFYFT